MTLQSKSNSKVTGTTAATAPAVLNTSTHRRSSVTQSITQFLTLVLTKISLILKNMRSKFQLILVILGIQFGMKKKRSLKFQQPLQSSSLWRLRKILDLERTKRARVTQSAAAQVALSTSILRKNQVIQLTTLWQVSELTPILSVHRNTPLRLRPQSDILGHQSSTTIKRSGTYQPHQQLRSLFRRLTLEVHLIQPAHHQDGAANHGQSPRKTKRLSNIQLASLTTMTLKIH
jgi:hypothetical protein